MDIGSILLILALLLLVVLFISRPFFERGSVTLAPQDATENHELSTLLAERDRILNALQELDFDHALGKIPEEDYPGQRAVLLQNGANTLRKLDALQTAPAEDDPEARIEAVIAARRADARRVPLAAGADAVGTRSVPRTAAPDDRLESILASRRRERSEKAVGFCPKCGGAVHKSDRFCPKCGTTLM
ncbi:MAG TPA: zinc ribbon domain-containing protein [Anaerolineales bacterium]